MGKKLYAMPDEGFRGIKKLLGVTDDEEAFFWYLYKKERRYRVTIFILILIILALSLSILL